MPTSLNEWLEQHAERRFAEQRAGVDTTKLVATFTTATAAALVAAGLQVGAKPSGWDIGAVIALGISACLALYVLLGDRLRTVDPDSVIAQAHTDEQSDAQIIKLLRKELLTAVEFNQKVVAQMRTRLYWQIGAAAAACLLATLGLLGWSLTV